MKQLGLLKLNLSSILNKRTLSPDMTIRKIRGKHNHSPTSQLSIFYGSAVLIRLYFLTFICNVQECKRFINLSGYYHLNQNESNKINGQWIYYNSMRTDGRR